MTRNDDVDVEGEGDVMLYALAKLVSIPTVSDDVHRERSVLQPIEWVMLISSCRQGAHLLRKILSQLGAQAELVSPPRVVSVC
jgi:di- and tripeptidase